MRCQLGLDLNPHTESCVHIQTVALFRGMGWGPPREGCIFLDKGPSVCPALHGWLSPAKVITGVVVSGRVDTFQARGGTVPEAGAVLRCAEDMPLSLGHLCNCRAWP